MSLNIQCDNDSFCTLINIGRTGTEAVAMQFPNFMMSKSLIIPSTPLTLIIVISSLIFTLLINVCFLINVFFTPGGK